MSILNYIERIKRENEGPRITAQEPRNMYQDGQLVQNTVDGSRPGYGGEQHGISTTQNRPEKYTKKMLDEFRKDMPPGLSIGQDRPGQFNYKVIIKGGNKNQPTIRMSAVVNENNKKIQR